MAWRAFLVWLVALVLLALALISLALRVWLPSSPALTQAILQQIHAQSGVQIEADQLSVSWRGTTGLVQAQQLSFSRQDIQATVDTVSLYLDLPRSIAERAARFDVVQLDGLTIQMSDQPASQAPRRTFQEVLTLLAAPLAMASDVRLTQADIRGSGWRLSGLNAQLVDQGDGPVLSGVGQVQTDQFGAGIRGQVKLSDGQLSGYSTYQAQGEWRENPWASSGELWLSNPDQGLQVGWRGEFTSKGDTASGLAQWQQVSDGWLAEASRLKFSIGGLASSIDRVRVQEQSGLSAQVNGVQLPGIPGRVLTLLPEDVAIRLSQIQPRAQVVEAFFDRGRTFAQLGSGQAAAFEGIPGGAFEQAQVALDGPVGVARVQQIASFHSLPASQAPLITERGQGWVAWQSLGDNRWDLAGQGLELYRSDFEAAGAFRMRLSPEPAERRFELLVRANSAGQPGQALVPTHILGEGFQRYWAEASPQAVLRDGLFWYSNGLDRSRWLDLDAGDVAITPARDYPRLTSANALLTWDGQRFDIRVPDAQALDMPLSNIRVQQSSGESWRVRAQAQVPGADYAGILASLPLELGEWPGQLNIDGDLAIRLNLAVGESVQGQIQIQPDQVTARWIPLDVQASELTGGVTYDLTQGFVDSELAGQFEGQPIRLRLADGRAFGLNADTQVKLSSATERFLPMMTPYVSGLAPVRIQISDSWRVEAELAGNASLPVPFDRGGRLTLSPVGDAIQIQLDDRVELRWAENQLAGRLDSADLIGWAQIAGGSAGEESGAGIEVDLRIRDTRLDELKMGASQVTANPDSVQVIGPNVRALVELGPIVEVDIQRLIATAPETDDDAPVDFLPAPDEFPSINLRVQDLAIDDQRIDSLTTQIRNSDEGVRFYPLELQVGGAEVQGRSLWSRSAAVSSMSAQITFADLGDLMESQGLGRPLITDQGSLQVDLRWPGYPWSPQFKQATGDIQLIAEKGRFLEGGASAEALRLLGVFNLSTITRRLRLDFSDLLQPGLAFDSLGGQARLRKGRLSLVEPLILDGPSAKMFLTGTSDLDSGVLDHKLRVQVPLSAQLPAATLLAGFPALAAGIVLLVDQVAGDSLSRIGETRYGVTGTFDAPVISPIQLEDSQ